MWFVAPKLAELLVRYCRDYPITWLRHDLAGDCPRLRPDTQLADLGDAHFPKPPGITGMG